MVDDGKMVSGFESPIVKAHRRYGELLAAGKMPTIRQKFRAHPTALRAIRLMCIECQGHDRKGPKTCNEKTCPLWLFRMGKKDPTLLRRKDG